MKSVRPHSAPDGSVTLDRRRDNPGEPSAAYLRLKVYVINPHLRRRWVTKLDSAIRHDRLVFTLVTFLTCCLEQWVQQADQSAVTHI